MEIIKSHVEIEIAVPDEPVVGQNRDPGSCASRTAFAIASPLCGRNDDDINSLGDKSLDVRNLADVIAIGTLDFYVDSEIGGLFYEIVSVALPAFLFQGVQGKSDERTSVSDDGNGSGNRCAPAPTSDDADQAGENDESKAAISSRKWGDARMIMMPGVTLQAGRQIVVKNATSKKGWLAIHFTEYLRGPDLPAPLESFFRQKAVKLILDRGTTWAENYTCPILSFPQRFLLP